MKCGEAGFSSSIDILLFDLGGVIVEIADSSILAKWVDWAGDSGQLWNAWFTSPGMRKYQTGAINTADFVEEMFSKFKFALSKEAFIEEYRNFPRGLYNGIAEILHDLSKKFTLVSFSNTDELHWDKLCNEDGIKSLFHRNYPSHLIGAVKPNKEAFLHVIKELGGNPGRILFFDDSRENVGAAKEAGLNAVRVSGIQELKCQLQGMGFL